MASKYQLGWKECRKRRLKDIRKMNKRFLELQSLIDPVRPRRIGQPMIK